MLKRMRSGRQLTGRSWRLLRSHPVLLRYPLTGAVLAMPAGILAVAGVVLWIADNNGAKLAAGGALVGIGVILLVVGSQVQGALRGIFGVILYRFAANDEALGDFSPAELESAVQTKA